MKFRYWQVFLVYALVAVLITACQAAPTPAPAISTQEEPTQESVQMEQAYPEPEAYPPPVQSRYIPYPSPGEGEQVDWAQAEAMILGGEVVRIFQSSSNQVTLYLSNLQQMVTTLPESDSLDQVIEECGSSCESIYIGME